MGLLFLIPTAWPLCLCDRAYVTVMLYVYATLFNHTIRVALAFVWAFLK